MLRLVAAVRINAPIGAEVHISPKTAGVHVSNIFRKLGVCGWVQAAVAERARPAGLRAGLNTARAKPKHLRAQILGDRQIRAAVSSREP